MLKHIITLCFTPHIYFPNHHLEQLMPHSFQLQHPFFRIEGVPWVFPPLKGHPQMAQWESLFSINGINLPNIQHRNNISCYGGILLYDHFISLI